MDLSFQPRAREALEWVQRNKQWINDRHVDLCRVAAPTFYERARAEWLTAQFKELGLKAEIDRIGNVVALQVGAPDGPLTAVAAHLDTVLAPRPPAEPAVDPDGTFRGPGVSDNGAGLAALLATAAALKSAGIVLPVAFVATVCEEGEGNLSGMRYLCRQSPIASRLAACLVIDGPGNDSITTQALASRRFEVQMNGPGGHSWTDASVPNPVHTLARAIAAFTSACDSAGPRASINFGVIEGGSSVNSIPAHAWAKADIRSENGDRVDELAALLTVVVEQVTAAENARSKGGRVAAKIREIGSRPAGKLPEGAFLLEAIRAADKHLGIRARTGCASTDANIPLSLGLAAASIGAGGQGGGAHSPNEWYHPDGRDLGLRRILLTLFLLARGPQP